MLGVSEKEVRASDKWSKEIGERFPECAGMVERVLSLQHRRYRSLAGRAFGWYRVTGAIEIVLSVSLPIFISFEVFSAFGQDQVILVISLAIALIAALRGFWRWEEHARLYRHQQKLIGELITDWEIEMLKLMLGSSEHGDREALPATELMLRKVREIVQAEVELDALPTPETASFSGPAQAATSMVP